MIKYLIVFYIIVFSFECIGHLFNKFFNFTYLPYSILGLIILLAIATCFSCLNFVFSLNNPYLLCFVFLSLTVIGFFQFIYSIFTELKSNKSVSLLCLIKMCLLGFLVILFTYQLNSSIPHEFGILESGTKWLSLINNNFFTKFWVNISLETGIIDDAFNYESNLGFYYLINYFLKFGSCLIDAFSPIEYCLFSFSPLLLYLIFDLFLMYLSDGIRTRNANLIIIGFAIVAFVFNYNALYYGFVGYLYNPLIIGTLVLLILNLQTDFLKSFVGIVICSLALLSTSTFSIIIIIAIIVISLVSYVFSKVKSSLLMKYISIFLYCFFTLCLLLIIQDNHCYLFNHFAFDYGNNYLYLQKSISILSLFIFCLALFYNKANLFCKATLYVLNPLVLNWLLGKFNNGFLILDVIFNFGFIYLLLNNTCDNLFGFDNDRAFSFSTCFGVLCLLLLTNTAEDTFNINRNIDSSKPFEYIYEVRANKYEYEIFSTLNNLTKSQPKRMKVISQLPLTNAYVSNIELLNGRNHYNSVCQYCDVYNLNLHEPNKLTNIFDVRDYADNQLYIESPSYDQACSLLKQQEYYYVIVRNDQYCNINGNYFSLKDVISSCSSLVYSNDLYTLLKIVY